MIQKQEGGGRQWGKPLVGVVKLNLYHLPPGILGTEFRLEE